MSNTTLYTYVDTPNVASNNFTTLYNGVQTVGVVTNYGNANVEAFLNAGVDGANQVQNIVMFGNLSVGGNSNLGNVGNVHISGGSLNYVLKTDGGGGLNWAPLPSFQSNTTSYVHFDVGTTGNNQTFTNANLVVYANSNTMAVMKNGINIEPSLYTISGSTLTINILLNTGDTIDVLPSTNGGGSGANVGGNITEVQYNGGSGTLSGNSSFAFTQSNSTLKVGNLNLSNSSNIKFGDSNVQIFRNANTLGLFSGDIPNASPSVGNIAQITLNSNVTDSNISLFANTLNITTGISPYKLWTFQSNGAVKFPDGTYQNTAYVTGATTVAGSNTQVQYNNAGVFGANANFTFNSSTNTLTVPNIVGNITNANYSNFAGTATTSVSAITAGNSNYANTANIANTANYANFAGNAYSVSGANVVGLVANANYAAYAGNIETSNNANYANYANFSGVAYAVAGANVTGYVPNASHATVADSANSIAGANVSGTVANANYSAYAGNVTIAAQANITSLGTLTSLVVSGNITTGNINSSGLSNIANTKFTKFNETVINGGSVSGTLTPDAAAGTIYRYTLTGNITLNSLANAVAGTSMTINLTQDGTGGRTLSSTMKFAGGGKTLSTAAGSIDVISLYYDGTNYYAVLSKAYS